jgi:hypothetical protein
MKGFHSAGGNKKYSLLSVTYGDILLHKHFPLAFIIFLHFHEQIKSAFKIFLHFHEQIKSKNYNHLRSAWKKQISGKESEKCIQ